VSGQNLAQRIGSPGQSGVADVTDFNLLHTLNRLFPLFQHLARQRQVHRNGCTSHWPGAANW
jgi:type VI secretion system protein ImpJ